MKIYELAEQAGVNKDTLSDWERGRRNPHPDTTRAVLAALDRLEEEMGIEGPVPTATPDKDPETPGLIRFKVQGAYGFDALVVEGPVENIDELVASVEKIMRNMQRREDNSQDS